MKNYRLDAYLHDKGYVTSRERSKQLILGKFVYVDDKLITKPSYPVKDGVKIEITGNLYISRGYLKIEKAVRAFNISPENKTAVDIGASTGGFTEYLLKHGAKKVYAIDVGRGQLHDTLKNDPRVINLENTNFRYMDRSIIKDHIDLVTVDVSFISLQYIFPKIVEISNINTDFPDPVSPVKTLNPASKLTDTSSNTAKFFIFKLSSILSPLSYKLLKFLQDPVHIFYISYCYKNIVVTC